jgi:hypothetical protein
MMRLILAPDYLPIVKQSGRSKKLSFKELSNDFSGFMQLFSWQDALLDM